MIDTTPQEIAKRMSVSLRGELTESSRTHFQHPNSGTLTPEVSSLVALGYKVQEGDLQGVLDVSRAEKRWLLNDADYSGNTPLVSGTDFLYLTSVR